MWNTQAVILVYSDVIINTSNSWTWQRTATWRLPSVGWRRETWMKYFRNSVASSANYSCYIHGNSGAAARFCAVGVGRMGYPMGNWFDGSRVSFIISFYFSEPFVCPFCQSVGSRKQVAQFTHLDMTFRIQFIVINRRECSIGLLKMNYAQ